MVSAVKVDGRRLHELAREGVEVERAARRVTVSRFDTAPDPARPGVYRAEVVCSSGTYIRVLADDLGRALGGGAHVANLRRTRIGSRCPRHAPDRRHRTAAGCSRRPRPCATSTPSRGRRRGLLDPHRAAPRPGSARRGRRRPLGPARRSGHASRRLRGDRQRSHPAGRGPARIGRIGRSVTDAGLPSIAMPPQPPAGQGTAVTIGAYDGVHLGHRALLRDLKTPGRRPPASPPSSSPSTATPPPWCALIRRPST